MISVAEMAAAQCMGMRSRYEQLLHLIDKKQPSSIIEIGTHDGLRAAAMCRRALHYGPVCYTGYDLFDAATDEANAREMNGKGSGSLVIARRNLDAVRTKTHAFAYTLIEGDTRETLHGKNITADFVFIDGGHSIETISGDYAAVKGSKCIVFDDYYLSGVDTSKFGCNEVIRDIPHYLLPMVDRTLKTQLVIQMAVVK